MALNYKLCPNCGSTNVLGILYGMPTHEAFLKAEAGEIQLGGCCITDCDPEYYCKECEYEWDKKQAVGYAYNQIEIITASVGGCFGGGNEESYRIVIRSTTAEKVVEELKLLELLNWKSEYVDLDILDGTQWSIEIVRKVQNIKKHGSNMFPKEWDSFCKLMKNTSGKKFG